MHARVVITAHAKLDSRDSTATSISMTADQIPVPTGSVWMVSTDLTAFAAKVIGELSAKRRSSTKKVGDN